MWLGLGLFQWMSGYWNTPLNQPAVGQRLIDTNGVALALNQTVKIVGTVVSLTATASHFDGVGVMLLHPNGSGPTAGDVLFVDPSQLVVGS